MKVFDIVCTVILTVIIIVVVFLEFPFFLPDLDVRLIATGLLYIFVFFAWKTIKLTQ